MATLKLTGWVTEAEANQGFEDFLYSTGLVDNEGDEINRHLLRRKLSGQFVYLNSLDDYREMASRTLDVRVASVTRDTDPESNWFGEYRIQIARESRAAVAWALEELPGLEMTEDGVIRVALSRPFRSRYETPYDIWANLKGLPVEHDAYDSGDYSEAFTNPSVSVTLSSDDYGARVEHHYVTRGDGTVPTGFLASRLFVKVAGAEKEVLGKQSQIILPQGPEFWDALLERHKTEGFTFADSSFSARNNPDNAPFGKARALCQIGSVAQVVRHAGIPSDTIVKRLRDKGTTAKRGRNLDVGTGEREAVGVWPTHSAVRAEAITGVGRKRERHRSEPLAVIGFGQDRKTFVRLSPIGIEEKLPQMEGVKGRHTRFWSAPVDRMVFQRSPVGWHGLIMLNIRVNAESTGRSPECWMAYCIPTFLSHEETKNPMHRYRRLRPEMVECIAQSYGLSDFLQQSLFAVEGAKAKLARKGLSLADFRLGETPDLPEGHSIRAWGCVDKRHPYEVDNVYYDGDRSKIRAEEVAYKLFSPFGALGNMPVHALSVGPVDPAHLEAAHAAAEAAMQPVATRRVLEV